MGFVSKESKEHCNYVKIGFKNRSFISRFEDDQAKEEKITNSRDCLYLIGGLIECKVAPRCVRGWLVSVVS